jgi:hypothetical protein
MTISPAIKAKVIELHLQKKGRNEIAREINISQGSVHNILRAYKDKSTAIADNGHDQIHSQSVTPVEDIQKSLSQEPEEGSSKTNGNLQQPVNGSNNPGSDGGNGYDGNFSGNDLVRLNLSKSTTTNLLKSAKRPPGL